MNPDHSAPIPDQQESVVQRLRRPDVRRILSYLGELKATELVPVMQIAADLAISYGSCAEHIRYLGDQHIVLVSKTPSKSIVRLNNEMNPAFFAAIVVEWDQSMGTHPSAGRRTTTAAHLRTIASED